MNEPHMFCRYGAGHSRMGSPPAKPGYSEYLCGHHVLLAHAKAYRLYKRDFAASQGGESLHVLLGLPHGQTDRQTS